MLSDYYGILWIFFWRCHKLHNSVKHFVYTHLSKKWACSSNFGFSMAITNFLKKINMAEIIWCWEEIKKNITLADNLMTEWLKYDPILISWRLFDWSGYIYSFETYCGKNENLKRPLGARIITFLISSTSQIKRRLTNYW